jgi:hypothetical protein
VNGAQQPVAVPDAPDIGNINSHFAPAFFKMLDSSKKLFLIFGETDRLYWEFDEKFYQPQKQKIDHYRELFEL